MSTYSECKEIYMPDIVGALTAAYILEGNSFEAATEAAQSRLAFFPRYAADIKEMYKFVSSHPYATSKELEEKIEQIKSNRRLIEKEENKRELIKFLVIAGVIVGAIFIFLLIFG